MTLQEIADRIGRIVAKTSYDDELRDELERLQLEIAARRARESLV